MSQQPPELPPLNPSTLPIGYATPLPKFYQRRRRPGAVTAVAVVAIVIGGLGSLAVFTLIVEIVVLASGSPLSLSPVYQAYQQNGVMTAWSLYGKISGVAMCMVMLF